MSLFHIYLIAMQPHLSKLTMEEKARNKHGPMCLYSFSDEIRRDQKATIYFPEFTNCAQLSLINRDDIFVPREQLVVGLSVDFDLEVYYPGFPILRHLQHTAHLEKARVYIYIYRSSTFNIRLTACYTSVFSGQSISTAIDGRKYDFKYKTKRNI